MHTESSFRRPHGRIHRGRGQGVRTRPPPPKNHQNIGVLSNTGPDPLKITKLPSQYSIWAIIGTSAKRHLNGVSLAGRRWPAFSGILDPSFLHQLKEKRCQSWSPSGKTFCIRAWQTPMYSTGQAVKMLVCVLNYGFYTLYM